MKDEKPKHHKPNKHTEIAKARDTISQYLLNPRGEIDGLLLSGGMFVKFPPHLSRELASLVKPQDEVVAVGQIEGPGLMKGYAIVNPQTAMALRDFKPSPHDHPGASEALKPFCVQGKIKHLKRDPRGRCNGAILDDGTILEFPPHAGETFIESAKANQAVHATGLVHPIVTEPVWPSRWSATLRTHSPQSDPIWMGQKNQNDASPRMKKENRESEFTPRRSQEQPTNLQTVAAVAPPHRGTR